MYYEFDKQLKLSIPQTIYTNFSYGLLPSQYSFQLGKSSTERNLSEFHWLIIRSFFYVALDAFFKSLSTFLSSIIYIQWRKRLTVYLHSLYFTEQHYYHVLNPTTKTECNTTSEHNNPCSVESSSTNDVKPIIDNPDERSLSTTLYVYIGSIFAYLLLALAILVFHLYGHLTTLALVQKISETIFIIGYLIFCFNQLNDTASDLTIIASNTHRVQSDLSYTAPDNGNVLLMNNLNLILREGHRLLTTGSSGVGKTSLFRILHSLWPVNKNGSFSYRSDQVYLLPQRPYFTNSSLYDELSYPTLDSQSNVIHQIQIEQFLTEWNLAHILNCVQGNIHQCPKYPWQDLLSSGEIQRLSFIRLLLRLASNEHPRINLVFPDEITSSIDVRMEMKMYTYLINQNLTMISIGHHDSLQQYHQLELELFDNENYMIKSI
ncbi:hypothetical protein I4U23_004247 [Adineta vaga]|nr:hypothetical protein I4U23_004247 [Adineta vaga]